MADKDNIEKKKGSKSEPSAVSSHVSTSRKKKNYNKNIAISVIIVVIALIVVLDFNGTISLFNLQPTAVVVNGEKIKQSEIDKRIKQILSSPQAQGIDTTDPTLLTQVRQQVLNELINTAILLQAAEEAGIVSDPEAVEEEYQLAVTQNGGEEALTEQLSIGGISIAEFRENLRDQLIIREFITVNTTIFSQSVTEEEVAEFYEQITASQEGVPPLSEIRLQVETQLIGNKQQVELDTFIATLREAALIDITE